MPHHAHRGVIFKTELSGLPLKLLESQCEVSDCDVSPDVNIITVVVVSRLPTGDLSPSLTPTFPPHTTFNFFVVCFSV